jgi:hypothetical protein
MTHAENDLLLYGTQDDLEVSMWVMILRERDATCGIFYMKWSHKHLGLDGWK